MVALKKEYRVELTPNAEAAYRRIFIDAQPHVKRENLSHPKVKLLRIIDECIDKIIPDDPFARKRALTGPLSGFFRVKKGRLRICYIGSSGKLLITVLYISETLRKEGDKNDPYALFTSLVMSGECDQFLERLGVRRPQRGSVQPFRLQ